MVPASSIKVSRVSMYSGSRFVSSPFAYGAFTLSGRLSQNLSARIAESMMRSEPRNARIPVCPLSLSLAATNEIDLSFSSSPYLDVSVQAVPFHTLWIGVWMTGVFPAGFPHSDICGSGLICSSPQLFAAYHVFLRLLVPRHPPCALFCLILVIIALITIFFIKELFGFRCLEKDISLIIICMKFSRYNAIDFVNCDAKSNAFIDFAMVHDWQSQSWD